jgi:hypothetical protein
MSLAKLFPPYSRREVDRIELACEVVTPYLADLTEVWTKDAATFLLKLIPENNLRLLASALLLENEINPTDKYLYRLIISRVLELSAQSQTDGIYKAPTTSKSSIPYQVALRKVCREIREDIAATGEKFRPLATLHLMTSETMTPISDESCSLCITSPPYLNNFDFAEMTRMELYYWRYAGSWGEITDRVRRHLIVNTTTAPSSLKNNQAPFVQTLSESFQSQLQPLIEDLHAQSLVKPGKKDYFRLVNPYFAQMQSVFRELRRILRPKSPFHIVVADAALYGVHIRTEQLLAELMTENGFKVLTVENLRHRGTRWVIQKREGARQPLGEFHIHAERI